MNRTRGASVRSDTSDESDAVAWGSCRPMRRSSARVRAKSSGPRRQTKRSPMSIKFTATRRTTCEESARAWAASPAQVTSNRLAKVAQRMGGTGSAAAGFPLRSGTGPQRSGGGRRAARGHGCNRGFEPGYELGVARVLELDRNADRAGPGARARGNRAAKRARRARQHVPALELRRKGGGALGGKPLDDEAAHERVRGAGIANPDLQRVAAQLEVLDQRFRPCLRSGHEHRNPQLHREAKGLLARTVNG